MHDKLVAMRKIANKAKMDLSQVAAAIVECTIKPESKGKNATTIRVDKVGWLKGGQKRYARKMA